MPSLAPAGIFTWNVFWTRSRPEPRHVLHGFSITVPLPRQRGHGCESEKRPCESEVTPRPPHCGQTIGAVPGSAPEPPHVWQAVSTSARTGTWTPCERVLERDVHLGLEVGAALGLRPALPAEAAARAAAEEAAEEIAEVEVLELRSAAAAAEGPAAVRRPELVVLRALLGIGEHVVRALDLLELRLVAAAVGMMLARELPVGLLDLVGRGVLGDAERVVQDCVIRPRSPGPAGAPCHRAGSPSAAPGAPSPPRRPRAGCASSASWTCGSKAPSVAISVSPCRCEQRGERAVDELDAFLELRLLVLGGRLERPLEVVEHGQELVHEPLVRARRQLGVLARDPLAVVVEVGREAEVATSSGAGGGLLRAPAPRRARSSSTLFARLGEARRSRRLRLFLVDDLVVGVLDDLVLGGRAAVAVTGRRRPAPGRSPGRRARRPASATPRSAPRSSA